MIHEEITVEEACRRLRERYRREEVWANVIVVSGVSAILIITAILGWLVTR